MAKETTLNEIGEMLAHVVEHMATKDDIAELRAELKTDIAGVRKEVASIHRELETITKQLDNVIGYRKEIDHALERIAAIEKHLGTTKKITA